MWHVSKAGQVSPSGFVLYVVLVVGNECGSESESMNPDAERSFSWIRLGKIDINPTLVPTMSYIYFIPRWMADWGP